MKMKFRSMAMLSTLALAGCSHITHTPPGTSVEVALAKTPEMVTPAAPPPVETGNVAVAGENVPAVEPPMPAKDALVEKVGEAYSRGVFCLRSGNDVEAIAAFEEAAKLDPSFSDAWESLALLYEKVGEPDKSLEAFKKAKTLARQ